MIPSVNKNDDPQHHFRSLDYSEAKESKEAGTH